MRPKTMLLVAGLVLVVLSAGCGDESGSEQALSKQGVLPNPGSE